MSFRRSTLVNTHGFDPALGTGTPARGGEDLAALISILWHGGAVGYEPAAVVRHRHRGSLAELQKQLRGYGTGFTAMLTALILGDRRHVVALAWQMPHAAATVIQGILRRLLVHRGTRGNDETAPVPRADYPRSLVAYELGSYPSGPLAYLRSRRTLRTYISLRATPVPGTSEEACHG
jgi:hypothetical protein